jgi:hypothetical protein
LTTRLVPFGLCIPPIPEPHDVPLLDNVLGRAVWSVVQPLMAMRTSVYLFREDLHQAVPGDPLDDWIRVFQGQVVLTGRGVAVSGLECRIGLADVFIHVWNSMPNNRCRSNGPNEPRRARQARRRRLHSDVSRFADRAGRCHRLVKPISRTRPALSVNPVIRPALSRTAVSSWPVGGAPRRSGPAR